MPQPRYILFLEALWWRMLMRIGMFFHQLARPRPMSASFAVNIPATLSSRGGGIGLIFYTPGDYVQRRQSGWKFPAVVNFHGGGFTIGTASDDARWATNVVLSVNAVVVSVDYRLAPEHPFPTAVEDGVNAILYLVEHAEALGLDVERFAVSGFSAGGNLAFTVPLMLQDWLQELSSIRSDDGDRGSQQNNKSAALDSNQLTQFKIAAIVAWYPPTDFTTSTAIRRASCTRPRQAMPNFFVELFDAAYIHPPSSDKSHPYLSPGVADRQVLETLPKDILLFTCEWDMLRAEAEAFGVRLHREAGKNVIHTRIPQVAHAWDRTPNPFHVDKAVSRYYGEACERLKTIFETCTQRVSDHLPPTVEAGGDRPEEIELDHDIC